MSYDKCSEMSPKVFRPLYFVGSEKIPQFPPSLRQDSSEKSRKSPRTNGEKFTDELVCKGRKENNGFSLVLAQNRGGKEAGEAGM